MSICSESTCQNNNSSSTSSSMQVVPIPECHEGLRATRPFTFYRGATKKIQSAPNVNVYKDRMKMARRIQHPPPNF